MNAYYNPVPAIQGKGSTAKIPQLVKEILPVRTILENIVREYEDVRKA